MDSAFQLGDLIVSEEVPDWIEDLARWTKQLLVPDWTIQIELSDCPNRENPQVTAKSSFASEYLSALIVFSRDLVNNRDGQTCVVHEVAHLFFSRMGEAQRATVIAGDLAHKQIRGIIEYDVLETPFEAIMQMADRGYDKAEEETVVKFARMLVGLRGLTDGNVKETSFVDDTTNES
jgi:hypothetical protein